MKGYQKAANQKGLIPNRPFTKKAKLNIFSSKSLGLFICELIHVVDQYVIKDKL